MRPMQLQESIHVYLGPSLDLYAAKQILPHAVYHPPIRCGDLLRLERLSPQHVLIIDGFYETMPSVWHKEILYLIELGVQVWGAASMGALRAAELHQLGMRGVGKIFNDFKEGRLTDDDEVAVLHQNQTEGFGSINDAMVNIRATCEELEKISLISPREKESLVQFCKAQFYPYRSLGKALLQLGPSEISQHDAVVAWLSRNGLINMKRFDAIEALEQVKKNIGNTQSVVQYTTPKTYYLNEIKRYAGLTPFETQCSFLPLVERQLKQLYMTDAIGYQLVSEAAFFFEKINYFLKKNAASKSQLLYEYMEHHQLLHPIHFDFIEEDSLIFSMMCQMICKYKITEHLLLHYRPILIHYYAFLEDEIAPHQSKLDLLIILILCVSVEVGRQIPEGVNKNLHNLLNCLKTKRGYTPTMFYDWLNPTHCDAKLFSNFLRHYAQAYFYVPCYTDSEFMNENWIYRVLTLFFK